MIPAPTRSLSKKEIADLHEWVESGGQLIMTVGSDRSLTNRDLLASFQFYEEKIPLSAIPPEVVQAVRQERPEDEILQAAAEQRDGFGYYVFDVKRGNEKFELLVHPKAGSVLAEKRHTQESWQAALVEARGSAAHADGILQGAVCRFWILPMLRAISFGLADPMQRSVCGGGGEQSEQRGGFAADHVAVGRKGPRLPDRRLGICHQPESGE